MNKKVLLIGYGSIGKRHARNLITLGVTPYVLTQHPDKLGAKFLKGLDGFKNEDIKYCIISSPTAQHLDDLRKCSNYFSRLKKILIEKPVEYSYSKGKEINDIAKRHRLDISVGYNLRFINAFDRIGKFIKERKDKIRIVEVVAGQDLREWRPSAGIRQSYSAYRKLGGGVDLDLSHEIDYILWLFGNRFKDKLMHRAKISNLEIKSPDIFKLVLDYKKFVVDVTLDYIRRPKERFLRIICDNKESLYYDFVTGKLEINQKLILHNNEIDASYREMLKAFLCIDKRSKTKLCSLGEALDVLKVLEV